MTCLSPPRRSSRNAPWSRSDILKRVHHRKTFHSTSKIKKKKHYLVHFFSNKSAKSLVSSVPSIIKCKIHAFFSCKTTIQALFFFAKVRRSDFPGSPPPPPQPTRRLTSAVGGDVADIDGCVFGAGRVVHVVVALLVFRLTRLASRPIRADCSENRYFPTKPIIISISIDKSSFL